jgi:hypothetical protein
MSRLYNNTRNQRYGVVANLVKTVRIRGLFLGVKGYFSNTRKDDDTRDSLIGVIYHEKVE